MTYERRSSYNGYTIIQVVQFQPGMKDDFFVGTRVLELLNVSSRDAKKPPKSIKATMKLADSALEWAHKCIDKAIEVGKYMGSKQPQFKKI